MCHVPSVTNVAVDTIIARTGLFGSVHQAQGSNYGEDKDSIDNL